MRVLPIDELPEHLRISQLRYLKGYLDDIKCATFVVEEEYVDRTYLIDYCGFHARSFKAPKRVTRRFHFFRQGLSDESFQRILAHGRREDIEYLQGLYLGFAVEKPVLDPSGKLTLGRTILQTYPSQDGTDLRRFLITEQSASLYGIPLKVKGLPFQTQDNAIGACAAASLWVSLHSLKKLFGVPTASLAEIAERATRYMSIYRRSPSAGLTPEQMLSFFRDLELDVELIYVDPHTFGPTVVQDAVKAYIACGIPVICGLSLTKTKKPFWSSHHHGLSKVAAMLFPRIFSPRAELVAEGTHDYHAVVISGYRCDKNQEVKELYVHDDQIGPYSRVRPQSDFLHWRNEWIDVLHYDEVLVNRLIIPVYPKIRLTFDRIYPLYLETRAKVQSRELGVELFLTQVNPYKESLLGRRLADDKVCILTSSLPRFLWIIRTHYNGHPILDVLFDGTSVFPKRICSIRYDLEPRQRS